MCPSWSYRIVINGSLVIISLHRRILQSRTRLLLYKVRYPVNFAITFSSDHHLCVSRDPSMNRFRLVRRQFLDQTIPLRIA